MRVGVVASWASAARLRSVLLQVQQREMDRLVLAFERPPPHPLAVLEKDAPELRYFLFGLPELPRCREAICVELALIAPSALVVSLERKGRCSGFF